ncbi:MAG: LysM domain-containing protein [Planctomycetota bacterium]
MLRALASAVVVVILAGAGFYLYSSFFGQKPSGDGQGIARPQETGGSPRSNGPNITAEGTPPALPGPSKPAPIPAPLAPRLEPLPPPLAPAPQAPKLKRTHVVQPGESLSGISRRYYGTPDRYGKIAAANNLRSRDVIRVGQVLVIPEGSGPPIIESSDDENEEHPATAAETQDFEPQPPTLSTTMKRDAGGKK